MKFARVVLLLVTDMAYDPWRTPRRHLRAQVLRWVSRRYGAEL